MAALAVLLILLGALGATMLVLQAGDRIEVVKITKPIPAGGSVNSSNTTSVLVAEDSGIHYVLWEQLDTLKRLKAQSAIPAGVVAVGEMFGNEARLESGKATVGLALKEGQYPTGLKVGDVVAAYRVGSDSGSGSGSGESGSSTGGNSVLADRATVRFVNSDKGSDELVSSTNLPITLIVDNDEAAGLAQAASNGEVAIVLIPGN